MKVCAHARLPQNSTDIVKVHICLEDIWVLWKLRRGIAQKAYIGPQYKWGFILKLFRSWYGFDVLPAISFLSLVLACPVQAWNILIIVFVIIISFIITFVVVIVTTVMMMDLSVSMARGLRRRGRSSSTRTVRPRTWQLQSRWSIMMIAMIMIMRHVRPSTWWRWWWWWYEDPRRGQI